MLAGAVVLLALSAARALPSAISGSSSAISDSPSAISDTQSAISDTPSTVPCSPSEDEVIFDQRQNGTDNVRLQMSDVTLVVAPAEALLALSPGDLFESQLKPKLADSKSSKSRHRLTNFLLNALHKNHN